LILTDANFHEEVSKGTVVVIMFMPGCPSCDELKPVMAEVARECPDVQFKALNTGANRKTQEELRIDQVPMLFLFKGGDLKGRAIAAGKSGVPSKERLVEWVNYRSTWEMPRPKLVEKPEVCEFCMTVRRKLFSFFPRRIRTWLEGRYANLSHS
jgi:thiol-disulfide isomerase/thioredoxin